MIKNLYTYLFIDDLIDPSVYSVTGISVSLKLKLTRDLAWLMLFSYILLIFNPVMPIIADKMAHTFWEEYHLVTVHGVYGNAHVDTELGKAAKQTDKDKTAPRNDQSDSEAYVHLITNISYNFSLDNYTSRSYPTIKFYLPVSYPDTYYQPPKV